MKSLQDQIVAWLAETDNAPHWHRKGSITDDRDWTYISKGKEVVALSDTISRELRDAEEHKRIARRDNGKSCEYRFLPPEHRERYIPWSLREDKSILFRVEGQENAPQEKKQRTLSQNAALHLYLELLSNELNDSGHDMRKVLKETVDIPWSKESAKKFLWKPIQEIMVDKGHTAELTTDEVDKIYKVLDRHISEKCGVHIDWPSMENTEEAINSIKE